MKDLPKIIAIIGPTGSGKTDLGVFLAQKYKGEIVSADSKQVYRYMDIGTAKEVDLPVKQHLINIKDPGEKITVAEYQKIAYTTIGELLRKKIVPILVGGSGMYVESVLLGYLFDKPGSKAHSPRYHSLKLGIDIDRQDLKEKIDKRTQKWLEQGMVLEIENLLKRGVSPAFLESCGQEYRYFLRYIQGKINKEEAVNLTNTSLHQFIKRQYTWWRRHNDIKWVKDYQEAEREAEAFLASK